MPTAADRTAVLGHTGSGKSVMAAWLLSWADFDKRPWVVIDYKGEDIYRDPRIRHHIREIKLANRPRRPGLYIVRPLPDERDEVEDFLWGIWRRGKTGLLVDEGYMLPMPSRGGAVDALLTQGRSKRVPMIVCSQRPRKMNPNVFLQANYFFVYDLIGDDDRDTLKGLARIDWKNPDAHGGPLGDYECYWFDVRNKRTLKLLKLPGVDDIVERIAARCPGRRWYQ